MTFHVTTHCDAPPSHCEHCGGDYVPRRPHQRFCGSRCRTKDWESRNPRVHVGVRLEGKVTAAQLAEAGITVGNTKARR